MGWTFLFSKKHVRLGHPNLPRSLKSTTTQPAVGGPKTFWEDQRAGDLKKGRQGRNLRDVWGFCFSFCFCGRRTKADFKDWACNVYLQCTAAWFEMATFSKLHLVRNSELDPVWKNMSYLNLEHNCTIFLCSLDVRNIVQGGDPLYAFYFLHRVPEAILDQNECVFFAKKTPVQCVNPRKKINMYENQKEIWTQGGHFCDFQSFYKYRDCFPIIGIPTLWSGH